MKSIPLILDNSFIAPVGRVILNDEMVSRLEKGDSFTISPILMRSDKVTKIIGISLIFEPSITLVNVPFPIGVKRYDGHPDKPHHQRSRNES